MTTDRGFELHPGAASDITSIWEFIVKENPAAARRAREDILDGMRRLVPFPRQGHQRADLTSRPLRFQTVRNYTYCLRTGREAAACNCRARRSPQSPRDRGHSPRKKISANHANVESARDALGLS